MPQYYYLVEVVDGKFGTGIGEEMHRPLPERGSYSPVWISVQDLLALPVLPRSLAEMVVKARSSGWPEPAPILRNEE